MESDRQSPISCTLPGADIDVALVWKAQASYLMLLQTLVRVPILIPHATDTIQPVCLNNIMDTIPQLAMWVISANVATFSDRPTNLILSSWRDKST